MSVSLRAEYITGEKFYTPINSNLNFETYWIPIAQKLGLEWVMLTLSVGLPLLEHQEAVGEIENEYLILKQEVLNSATIEFDYAEWQVKYIDKILKIIEEFKQTPEKFTHIFLG